MRLKNFLQNQSQFGLRRMAVCALAIGALPSLVGCGDSPSKPGGDVTPESSYYQFDGDNGCNTGRHSYSSVDEFCRKLINDDLNQECALPMRRKAFLDHCTGRDAGNNPPTPGGSPAPKCKNLAALKPKGPEVSFESLLDGQPGSYRLASLTQSSVMSKPKAGTTVSSSYMVNVVDSTHLDNSSLEQGITCKDMTAAPDGSQSSMFSIPMVISRNGGLLSGNLDGEIDLYGENRSQASDKFTVRSRSGQFKESSLLALKEKSEKTGFTLRAYRISETKIQLVYSGQATEPNEDQVFEVFGSMIYEFHQPVPSSETERELTPEAKPVAPMTFPKASFEDLSKVCKGYRSVDYQVNCIERLDGKNVPLAVIPLCGQYRSVDYQVQCLEEFIDKPVLDRYMQICDQYRSVDYKKECLLKFSKKQN